MRPSLLLALPALCLAAEPQQPLGDKLKNWWNKATSYVDSSVPTIIPDPLDAGAAKVAEVAVVDLNSSNWKSILTPGEPKITGEPDEWLIYINGGNKTCHSGCVNATKAWNTAAALLSALPSSPSLAQINCDADSVLCNYWYVSPPVIVHVLLSPTLDPVVRYFEINETSVTAADIAELHTKRGYEKKEPYTGLFQPWTGFLAKSGLAVPYGYFVWAFAILPAWAPMVLVSFLSRSIMPSRRLPQQRGGAGAAPAAAAPPKK